jgi:riboflavin kinase / FMN adenylyltransferase
VPQPAAIVTIGNFDGVHRGHQAILEQVVGRARVLGLRSCAVTFDPHPRTVLYPGQPVAALTGPEEKEALLRRFGIDDVWTIRFTPELSRLAPDEFMHLVAERQPIAELWVGADFALGRGRSGTIGVLADIGCGSGWALHVVPPFRLEGQVVSSTAIRTLLAAGAVQGAAELLGRPYAVAGELEPTGVLRLPPERALPRAGLSYAGRIATARGEQAAVVTISAPSDEVPLVKVAAESGDLPEGAATVTFLRRAG